MWSILSVIVLLQGCSNEAGVTPVNEKLIDVVEKSSPTYVPQINRGDGIMEVKSIASSQTMNSNQLKEDNSKIPPKEAKTVSNEHIDNTYDYPIVSTGELKPRYKYKPEPRKVKSENVKSKESTNDNPFRVPMEQIKKIKLAESKGYMVAIKPNGEIVIENDPSIGVDNDGNIYFFDPNEAYHAQLNKIKGDLE